MKEENIVSVILYKNEKGEERLERQCMYHNAEWAQATADRLNNEENTNKYYIGEQRELF
jgi:hypothetical protein